MATIVLQQSSALRDDSRSRSSSSLRTTLRSSTPIPNKHIPFCPPGANGSSNLATPPNSPPQQTIKVSKTSSLLHPPSDHRKLLKSPAIYGLDADSLAKALIHAAEQPLPNPASVFPWMHGLHPSNHTQLHFFGAKKKSQRKAPKCLRGITIVKAGGDLSRGRIKGAVAPDEVFSLCDTDQRGFLDCDPAEGFSVRNFHIQAAKMAQVSDIVVYGDDQTDHRIIRSVAERAAKVQRQWKRDLEAQGQAPETFHTFVLTSTFEEFEETHPELVAVSGRGKSTGQVLDFLHQERVEMCEMSEASEIAPGIFAGPTPNASIMPETEDTVSTYDVMVECADHANLPDSKLLSFKLRQLQVRKGDEAVQLSFPSSGSILPSVWGTTEAEAIILMCKWLHNLANSPQIKSPPSTPDKDGDIQMTEFAPCKRRVLIHCPDGYTETSMLAIAYHMFAECKPLHEAWLSLHCEKQRNFFAYASDVALLRSIEEKILEASPRNSTQPSAPPAWLAKLDGSLPSRILPYMYLGNLTHANNPEMLKELGIRRIVSVGEPVSWTKYDWDSWGRNNVMFIDRVQDNGIDELGTEIEQCLKFIRKYCDPSNSMS